MASFYSASALQHVQARLNHNTQVVQTSTENLARASLPGGQRLEKPEYQFDAYVNSGTNTLARTHCNHIPASFTPMDAKAKRQSSDEISATGNNIVAVEELQNINTAGLEIHQDMKAHESFIKAYMPFAKWTG